MELPLRGDGFVVVAVTALAIMHDPSQLRQLLEGLKLLAVRTMPLLIPPPRASRFGSPLEPSRALGEAGARGRSFTSHRLPGRARGYARPRRGATAPKRAVTVAVVHSQGAPIARCSAKFYNDNYSGHGYGAYDYKY
jgi:hypothetical protein